MANRQTTILSTQDCDQALTCCVKMVQQVSYAQEVKELMEQQGVAATSSLKTLHPFINQEGFSTGGGRLQQYTSLTSNASDDFHQIITSQNWLSKQNTQGPQLTASLHEKFWIPRIRNFKGASNQLHEVYNMLQPSSQMARVQDFLASDEREWRFIPPRGPHFRGLGSSSNIHEVQSENIGFLHCHLRGTSHITC